MKKIIFFGISVLFAVFLLPLILAENYGSLRYGKGIYGRGDILSVLNVTNYTSASMNGSFSFSYFFNHTDNADECRLIIKGQTNLSNLSTQSESEHNNTFTFEDAGSYNWSLNCTDSVSNIVSTASQPVVVNLMKEFNIKTDLSLANISNITNLFLEVSSYGKINFSDAIDLSQGFDLDMFINITSNKIELDAASIPALNKSATLSLTGLTSSNPRILRDGQVCPANICKKISYSGGVLIFNVSQWSSYSSEETPSSGDSSGGSTGGGGGAGSGGGGGGGPPSTPIITDFSVDKTALKVVLKQGQTKTETLTVKNIGTTIFDIKAYLNDIVKFKASPEEHELITTLQPNEEKTIEIVFTALENEIPDIYPAKIRLKSPSKEKSVDTVIEVDSAEPLFDVDAEVLSETKKIFPGEELLLEVNLFNVRGFGRVDVNVEYAIKDFNGNVVAAEHETLAVETQAKFTRSLLVPSDLAPGNYVALVKVTYADSIGTSSDVFEVKARAIRLSLVQLKDYKIILLIGFVAVLTIFVFSAYKFGYLRKKMPKGPAEEIKQFKDEEKTQKLRKELEALESARKSGFISEESYQRSKERIQNMLNK